MPRPDDRSHRKRMPGLPPMAFVAALFMACGTSPDSGNSSSPDISFFGSVYSKASLGRVAGAKVIVEHKWEMTADGEGNFFRTFRIDSADLAGTSRESLFVEVQKPGYAAFAMPVEVIGVDTLFRPGTRVIAGLDIFFPGFYLDTVPEKIARFSARATVPPATPSPAGHSPP